VKGIGLTNFKEVMFWDRPEKMLNKNDKKDIIA
jgi:hypothetical protein